MRALYANESSMESTYLLDEFTTVKAGDPFRLFPLGQLVKNGTKREITADLLRKFKLPHFKPPIKAGSHDESAPAIGFINGLEVRDDGLYAIPEYNEQGQKAVAEGHYRYQSPEVIWEGGFEDPNTGDLIGGPLIAGAAFLHMPHLGNAAALYSVTPIEEVHMSEEMVSVPMSFWDKFLAKLFPPAQPPEVEQPPEQPQTDEFAATVKERDEYKARLEAMEAERVKTERVAKFAADLQATKVPEGAEMLAGMTDEQAAWVVERFKALSAQINDAALFTEKGTEAEAPTNPVEQFNAAIQARASEKKISYIDAAREIVAENPNLAREAGYK